VLDKDGEVCGHAWTQSAQLAHSQQISTVDESQIDREHTTAHSGVHTHAFTCHSGVHTHAFTCHSCTVIACAHTCIHVSQLHCERCAHTCIHVSQLHCDRLRFIGKEYDAGAHLVPSALVACDGTHSTLPTVPRDALPTNAPTVPLPKVSFM
jgi:hypothetical protein